MPSQIPNQKFTTLPVAPTSRFLSSPSVCERVRRGTAEQQPPFSPPLFSLLPSPAVTYSLRHESDCSCDLHIGQARPLTALQGEFAHVVRRAYPRRLSESPPRAYRPFPKAMDEHLDTSWCPVCEKMILPKRFTVPIATSPSPAPVDLSIQTRHKRNRDNTQERSHTSR